MTTTQKESRFNSRLTMVASIATVLALFIAVGAWWWPRSPDGSDASAAPGIDATRTTASAPPAAGSAPAGTVEYLAGPGFPAEAGGALLVSVPRAVRNDPAYASHPIAIKCPSNRTGNQASDVTYLLRGRYVRFDATVHPYYPPNADRGAASWVFAMVDVRQRDGTLQRSEAGRQQWATMMAPAALTAELDNAEKLTVSIQCADPNGTIVLTDARLTGAG